MHRAGGSGETGKDAAQKQLAFEEGGGEEEEEELHHILDATASQPASARLEDTAAGTEESIPRAALEEKRQQKHVRLCTEAGRLWHSAPPLPPSHGPWPMARSHACRLSALGPAARGVATEHLPPPTS